MSNQIALIMLSVIAAGCSRLNKVATPSEAPKTWARPSSSPSPLLAIAHQPPDSGTTNAAAYSKRSDFVGFSREPILFELLKEAYRNNLGLASTRANVSRARALRSQARALQLPSVDLLGSASVGSSLGSLRDPLQQYGVGLEVSWEPDLWHRLGSRVAATEATVMANDEDWRAARRLLSAEVIISYLSAVEAQLQVRVGRRNLESLRRTLGYVEVQFERGLRSGQDIALIRTDVLTAAAGLATTLNQHRGALRALEVLVGRYPTAVLKTALELPTQPNLGSLGVPAELLENRPDLRAARHRLEAARATRLGLERDRFPKLRLSGTISAASELAENDNIGWQLGSEVRIPLVDGGLRRALVDEGRAGESEAAERYQAAALSAFLEVEEQLDRRAVLAERHRGITAALAEARKARGYAQFRYESGASDLLEVLSIQGRVLSLESALVTLERQRLVGHVELGLAIGADPSLGLSPQQ